MGSPGNSEYLNAVVRSGISQATPLTRQRRHGVLAVITADTHGFSFTADSQWLAGPRMDSTGNLFSA